MKLEICSKKFHSFWTNSINNILKITVLNLSQTVQSFCTKKFVDNTWNNQFMIFRISFWIFKKTFLNFWAVQDLEKSTSFKFREVRQRSFYNFFLIVRYPEITCENVKEKCLLFIDLNKTEFLQVSLSGISRKSKTLNKKK